MISEQITLQPQLTTAAKLEDLAVIRDILIERGDLLTLDNARFVLLVGLTNMPDAWTITPDELAEMWDAGNQ